MSVLEDDYCTLQEAVLDAIDVTR